MSRSSSACVRSFTALFAALMGVLFTGTGCRSESSGGDGGTDAGEDTISALPGALALVVDGARQHRTGAEADTPLVIAFTLANGEGGAPVPLNPLFVSVRFGSGLIKAADSWSSTDWLEGQSPAATDLLAGGSSYGPWLVAVDTDVLLDPPVEITYSAPDEGDGGDLRQASAELDVEPCVPCTVTSGSETVEVCTYVDRDPMNCGRCGLRDSNAAAECHHGLLSECEPPRTRCEDGDLSHCTDLQTDTRNCGRCGATVPENGRCEDGAPMCPPSEPDLCEDECVDLNYDNQSCGTCGHGCGSDPNNSCGRRRETYAPTTAWFGTDGHCTRSYDEDGAPPASTCNEVCSSLGLTCLAPSQGSWGGAYAFCSGNHWDGDCGDTIPNQFLTCSPHAAETRCNCVD